MSRNNRRQNQQKNQKSAPKAADDKVDTSKQEAKAESNPNTVDNKANALKQEPKAESKTADNKPHNTGGKAASQSKTRAAKELPADTATEQKKSTASQVSGPNNKPTSPQTKPAVKTDKAVSSTPRDNTPSKNDPAKNDPAKNNHAKNDPAKNNQVKKADKQAKTAATKPAPTATQPQQKKGNGLWVGLALLTGFIGTGLGAYCFNELRQVNSNESLTKQLTALENKVTDLTKNDHSAALKEQLAQVVKQQDALQTAEQGFNARIAEIAQLQKGLTKSIQADIDSTLANKMATVDELLEKVKNIELGQQGLSKNLNQVTAANSVVTEEGLMQQEVGYLLRMANYKLQFESDVSGAIGLLKMAEQKLLTINNTANTPLIEGIREKLIQLDGVTPVDTDKLLGNLQAIAREIPQLVVKTNKTESQPIEVGEKATADTDADADNAWNNTWKKAKSVLASGIKYTPADPSKIDISAETILIKKRLMQADVKTAELAVQSHNKVMLAESIRSLTDSLNHYFADDDVAKSIKEKLTAISHSELETVLPDLAGLIKQQQTIQAQ